MEAGTLNRRITFLAPTAVRDSYGEDDPTWAEVCTVWASLKPLTGRQLALAQANTATSTATHEIRVRYRADLEGKVNFRVRYGERSYSINSILNMEEANRELRIAATEVVT